MGPTPPVSPKPAMPPPADIVKVAIEWPKAFPKLMEIDQVGASIKKFFQHFSYFMEVLNLAAKLANVFSLKRGHVLSN